MKFKFFYVIIVEKEVEDLKNVLCSFNLEVNLLLIDFYCFVYEILIKVYFLIDVLEYVYEICNIVL